MMRRLFFLCGLIITTAYTSFAQKTNSKPSFDTEAFDSIFLNPYKPGEPGAAAIVVHKGKIVYQKAIGMADMELNVPLQTNMIFKLGSITKQFTAIAILQLVQQGKLSLQDDIRKILPELPYKETITVEQLLNHSSGIRSYTNLPGFLKNMRNDWTPMEIINLTATDTLEFKPGTGWNYNNTGYIILGAIIEKITGKTYADYVQQYLFTPAGMKNSYYGSETTIIKNRAKGYSKDKNGYRNADYLSMTQPYAAGALMATLEDLWKWNKALYSYQYVSKEWIEKATTPFILPNGKSTYYGYGLSPIYIQGSKAFEHSGGIPGFVTDAVYLPEEEVFVAVFTNCDGQSPAQTTFKLAAQAIGKPYTYKSIPLTEEQLKEYEAVYSNDQGEERIIRLKNGKLTSQRGSGSANILIPNAKDNFILENSLTQLQFLRNKEGKVEALLFKGIPEYATWKRTSKPLPAAIVFLEPDSTVLAPYAGSYELSPGFIFTITLEGKQLYAQATGQSKLLLQAITNTLFQVKDVDAKIEFITGTDGKIEKLILRQAGRELPAKKQ